MDSRLLVGPCRLYRRFATIERAHNFVMREYVPVLFREGDCTDSDASFVFHLVMRVFDNITGIPIARPGEPFYIRARERWASLHIRLHRLRTKLGNTQLLESVTLLDSSLRVFIAFLRIWSHVRGLKATWPSWMVHIFHHEFQKYLPLV